MANGLLQRLGNPQRISVLDSARGARQLLGGVGAQGLQNEITGLTGGIQQAQLSGQAPEQDSIRRLGQIAPEVKAQFAQVFGIPQNEQERLMGFAQDIGVAARLAKSDPDSAYRYIVNRRNELRAFGQDTAKTDQLINEFESGNVDLAVANLDSLSQSLQETGFLPTAQERIIKQSEISPQGQVTFLTPGGGIESRDSLGFRGKPEKKAKQDPFTLSKGQIRFGPNGEVIASVPDTKPGARVKPPTDAQNISAGFADRMIDANKILTKLDNSAEFNSAGRLERFRGLFGATATSDFQSMEQAKSNFITAVLRKESGAVISDAEFDRKEKELFAQPGNSEKVIQQKIKARQREIQNMVRNSGTAFKPQVETPQVGAPQVQQIGRFNSRRIR